MDTSEFSASSNDISFEIPKSTTGNWQSKHRVSERGCNRGTEREREK